MKKLTALAVAAIAAPLAIGISATPAQASDCTAVYPPGQAWKLRISPSYALVKKGAAIDLGTRLVRGNLECGPGERIGWYTRGRGKTVFNLSRATTGNSRGLVVQRYIARDDFRYFTDHLRGNARVAQSVGGLIQTR
ncbi:MAG: hypothetical protein Q8R60_11365 [Mycobacteriales bacterium]|nr:hypothetical protein [Mycobacteriales bacterium]